MVNDTSLIEERLKLLDELEKIINFVHQRCISKAQKPVAYVECPLQHDEEFGPHLPLDTIKPIMYCNKVYPKQPVPSESYNLLLPCMDQPGEHNITSI